MEKKCSRDHWHVQSHLPRAQNYTRQFIICSADKGKAVVVEDTETYIYKMQQQINEGDCELAKGSEKSLLRKIHQKLLAQLKKMGWQNSKSRDHFWSGSSKVQQQKQMHFLKKVKLNQTRKPAFTCEGERDLYTLGFMPWNIFKKQVIQRGILKLSKRFFFEYGYCLWKRMKLCRLEHIRD